MLEQPLAQNDKPLSVGADKRRHHKSAAPSCAAKTIACENTHPSTFPSLAEIPLTPTGSGRIIEDIFRLMLIPTDDADLRDYAVRLFNQEEVDNNRVGGPAPGPSLFGKISDMHARTPGGVAWQIATIVATFDNVEPEEFQWWHRLLDTALVDLIDLERQRVAASRPVAIAPLATCPPDSASASVDYALDAAETEIARLYDGVDASQPLSEEESNTLFKQAVALDDYVAAAVPTSLSDCAVKLRRLLDRTTGMVIGGGGNDIPSLARVLDYIETVTGAPTHPTRPIARSWGEDE